MEKTIICIGGGELRSKETQGIDEYIANKAKLHAGEKRAYGLFIPTASHDSMPYYNTFHKMYTGVFNIKTDVALTVYGEMNMEKIHDKFMKADFIYVGGGDTVFMLEHWKKTGLLSYIKDAYDRGVILCGLSAGAICWFEKMYTDSGLVGMGSRYSIYDGLGWLKGEISPHYNDRMLDFDEILRYNNDCAYGLENNSAIEFINGEFSRSISCGGNAYRIECDNGVLKKTKL